MKLGQTYKIPSTLLEEEILFRAKKKYIPAVLIQEYRNFYLFQTEHYKTTIHKQDVKLIKEG